MISAVNLLPAVLALCAALTVANLLSKKNNVLSHGDRFVTIDGLRGYLAFFVFLHHSCIWYFYLQHGRWEVPPSNVYTNFGQAGVAFFFMITGFLFVGKIKSRERPVDWAKLFTSRLTRIGPLYICVALMVLFLVGGVTGWKAKEPILALATNGLKWLALGIFNPADVNGVAATGIMVAYVTWSLRYEWFFYLTLPVIAWMLGRRPPLAYLVVGAVGLAGLMSLGIFKAEGIWHLLSFAGGGFSAYIVDSIKFRTLANSRTASILVILFTGISLTVFPTTYAFIPLTLLFFSFALIASGTNVFGSLQSKTSRMLGEMAYSIYLLHGLLLYVCFKIIIGTEYAASFSPIEYWMVIIATAPLLILISFFTYTKIEKFGSKLTPNLLKLLRLNRFSQPKLIRPP